MDLVEAVGESSSPSSMSLGSFSYSEMKSTLFMRLKDIRKDEESADPDFLNHLNAHLDRFRYTRYLWDINLDRVEDVLLHKMLLAKATDDNQPVFHVRFIEDFWTRSYVDGAEPPHDRQKISQVPVHEVIFSTVDKPRLLTQISALLYDIGLKIREAHVYSTTDGYSLDVFVVEGWPIWDPDKLHEEMKKAIARSKESWSSQPAVEEGLENFGDCEIDRRLLKIGEQIASGDCTESYRGVYHGHDVAVKMLRSEIQTGRNEFKQEVSILREVKHRNIVRFIGVCTKALPFYIITEYMAGGSLFEYLRKKGAGLELSQLVKFAIDVSKGMEYLHQKNIIHRDIKSLNLLIDADNVVKVADFGVARKQGDVMTRETGTYKWMAPEVIINQHYDKRADIYSFAIVLWEMVTAKVPYDPMTPVQAAVGVSLRGLRPEIPTNMDPKLLDLMKRCWDVSPDRRPPFSQITTELEAMLPKHQDEAGPSGVK